jgi:polyferredoxin
VINRLFKSFWFPLALQILTLVVFIALIIGGLSANTSDMAFAKVLRNTNIANLVVWSYWWPMIILSAIFFGRIWCTICPMELLTSLASKIGLKKNPSKFLQSGWVITLLYIFILFVGIQTLAIHRVPFRMALYMISLMSMAILSGLIFKRNSFCAHICPIGFLLGLYARLAPLGWGVVDKAVCESCIDKRCIAKKNAYDFQGRSCGVGLYPSMIETNSDCLVCGQCLKACQHDNPGWFGRKWFKDILELKPFSAPQVLFCLVVSGFVIYEVFTEWAVTKDLLLWLPRLIAANGFVKSVLLFFGLPLILWGAPFGLFRLIGGKLSMSNYLLRFGIAFIPIMAAAHITKSMLKMTSRIPYWEFAVSDPQGAITAQRIIEKSAQLSSLPAWRDPVITVISLVLMTIGIVLSTVVIRRLIIELNIGWQSRLFYLIPAVYGGGFLAMLIMWRVSL